LGLVPALVHLGQRPAAGAAGRELLAQLARLAPLLPGADQLVFVDLDSMQRLVYGHEKQGAAVGYTKTRGKTVEGCGIVSQLLTCGIPG
jgi:hypothetical protein